MVRIEKYTDQYYPEICDWLAKRSLPSPPKSYLSPNGLIIPGVACGFLYLTDSAICHLDSFIANPEAPEDERDEALDLISISLLKYAKTCGCELAMCDSQIDAITARAKKLGFSDLGLHVALSKEL